MNPQMFEFIYFIILFLIIFQIVIKFSYPIKIGMQRQAITILLAHYLNINKNL